MTVFKSYQWIILLLITLLLRLPAFWTPLLNIDESQFAEYANMLLSGGLPYIDSVDTKPLGMYYFFAGIFYLFGKNNMIAVHIVTALWVFATAYYCHLIALKIKDSTAGIWTALFYIVFTTTYTPKYIATSIVVIMMLPLSISIYYIIRYLSSQKNKHMLLSGILFGIACLFKYTAGINLIITYMFFIIILPLIQKRLHWNTHIRPLIYFTFGSVLIGFLFYLPLQYHGIWDEFVFWSISGSATYTQSNVTFTDFIFRGITRLGSFMLVTGLIWYLGIGYCITPIRNFFKYSSRNISLLLIILWGLLSLIPVCVGGRFFEHYFIQLLPALCILAGIHAVHFFHKQYKWLIISIAIILPSLLSFTARVYAPTIYAHTGYDYPGNYKQLGNYIAEHTSQTDRIFVWGFATPIYTYSNRAAASRFLWCDWLTGRIAGSNTSHDSNFDTQLYVTDKSWQLLFMDLEMHKPIYFIDTSPGNYHDYGKYPISKYPALQHYIDAHYVFETDINGAHFYHRKGSL